MYGVSVLYSLARNLNVEVIYIKQNSLEWPMVNDQCSLVNRLNVRLLQTPLQLLYTFFSNELLASLSLRSLSPHELYTASAGSEHYLESALIYTSKLVLETSVIMHHFMSNDLLQFTISFIRLLYSKIETVGRTDQF